MSFVKMSSEYIIDGTTDLENIYISEYMPTMPDIINKVYIYGLFLARQHDNADNCAESFAARLGLDSASLLDAYAYLAELGLVQVLRTVPVEVRYLPIKLAANAKKYKRKIRGFQHAHSGDPVGTSHHAQRIHSVLRLPRNDAHGTGRAAPHRKIRDHR